MICGGRQRDIFAARPTIAAGDKKNSFGISFNHWTRAAEKRQIVVMTLQKILFILGFIFALTPFASPPVALAVGLVFGLTFVHPFLDHSQKLSKTLLKICVVGLGFGMNLHEVLKAGKSGFFYTALSILFALSVGWLLGKLLKVGRTDSYLISVGTAICGGSAIAAVGPVAGANDDETSVSLGTIFILNSVALILFPMIGTWLNLSQTQFGLWAALAIHDTSSVVGAGAKYGAIALAVGTTVKLARALWIVPVTLATAAVKRSGAKIKYPWFIGLFVIAAIVNTYLTFGASVYAIFYELARVGLTVTLYLIGSHISRRTLKQVGVRPLAQGIILWLIVSVVSLWLIFYGYINL